MVSFMVAKNGHNQESVKSYWKIMFVVLGVLVIAFGGWFVTRPKEPVYQGQSFGEWFDEIQYVTNDLPRINPKDPAFTAITAMGKNAAPFLIRQLELSFSPIRVQAIEWRDRIFGKGHESRYFLTSKAFHSLCELGTNADVVVLDLIKLTRHRDPQCRLVAVYLLGNIHTRPEICIPALLETLKQPDAPNYLISTSSADALASFGSAAKSALPTLISMRTPNARINPIILAQSIKEIDPEVAKTLDSNKP
jgi:hypothetical protein